MIIDYHATHMPVSPLPFLAYIVRRPISTEFDTPTISENSFGLSCDNNHTPTTTTPPLDRPANVEDINSEEKEPTKEMKKKEEISIR